MRQEKSMPLDVTMGSLCSQKQPGLLLYSSNQQIDLCQAMADQPNVNHMLWECWRGCRQGDWYAALAGQCWLVLNRPFALQSEALKAGMHGVEAGTMCMPMMHKYHVEKLAHAPRLEKDLIHGATAHFPAGWCVQPTSTYTLPTYINKYVSSFYYISQHMSQHPSTYMDIYVNTLWYVLT